MENIPPPGPSRSLHRILDKAPDGRSVGDRQQTRAELTKLHEASSSGDYFRLPAASAGKSALGNSSRWKGNRERGEMSPRGSPMEAQGTGHGW